MQGPVVLPRGATYGALLSAARGWLKPPLSPPFEAEELLARATGRPRAWFHARRHVEATDEETLRYEALVARRAEGAPLQYLLGEWEFLGRTFRVDARALIPRTETEAIVEIARRTAPEARVLLDVGTGSGVLAVSLALERPEARVVALDRSVDALALARENARRFGVLSRVAFLASDWLSALAKEPAEAERFDLVVSNPPYVPLAHLAAVDKTVSEYEPPLALYGGDDGLDPLRVLLAALPSRMRSGAPFVFEIGYGQAKEVSGLVAESGAFALEEIRLDPFGIPRTALTRRR